MKLLSLIILLVLPMNQMPLVAADNQLSGSRAAAMANASVALFDFWAISHNQAGIAGIEAFTAGMYTGNRFSQTEMPEASFAAILPAGSGNLGFSLQHFGGSLYAEQKAGLTYARFFGNKLSAGIQLNYMLTSISEGYGRAAAFTAEIGFIYEIAPGLFLGTHLFNPTKSILKTETHHPVEEYISSVIRSGLVYQIGSKVLLSAEVEKDIRHAAVPKIGLEYNFIESIVVRAGISNNPMLNAFGFGFTKGSMQLDISASHHYLLGYSKQAGIIYSF